MIEATARVIKATPDYLVVETETQSACTQCASSGCSSSVLAKLFSVKRNRMQMDNHLGAVTGELVIIGLPDLLLVKAALWIYIVPLLLMVLVTIAASVAGLNDAMQSLLALCSLGMGFYLVYRITRSTALQDEFKPSLLRKKSRKKVTYKKSRK